MGLLDHKVIPVFGGARGVVAQGGRVVIADLLEEAVEALAQELGDAATFVHLDVRQEKSWRNVVATAAQLFRRLNGIAHDHRRRSMCRCRNDNFMIAHAAADRSEMGG